MSKAKKTVKLAHPVTSLYNELAAFLAKDSGVEKTALDFKKRVIRIYPKTAEKAEALCLVLGDTIEIGKDRVRIAVYDPNGKRVDQAKLDKAIAAEKLCPLCLIKTAMKGNGFFSKIVQAKDDTGTIWTFVCMKNAGVQFKNDDMSNPWLTTTRLAADTLNKFCSLEHYGIFITTVAK